MAWLPDSVKFSVEQHRTVQLREARSQKLAKIYTQNAEHLFGNSTDQLEPEQLEITEKLPPPSQNRRFAGSVARYQTNPACISGP